MKKLKACFLLLFIFPVLGSTNKSTDISDNEEKMSIFVTSEVLNSEIRFDANCNIKNGPESSAENGLTPMSFELTAENFECVFMPLNKNALLKVEVIRKGPDGRRISSKATKVIKKGTKIKLSGLQEE